MSGAIYFLSSFLSFEEAFKKEKKLNLFYRCLKLEFNPASRIYSYKGEDCGVRQKYICEYSRDDESANKLERTARELSQSMEFKGGDSGEAFQ